METRTKIILGIIILATGITLALLLRPSPSPADSSAGASAKAEVQYEPQENEGGNVTVSVTPVTLKPGFPPSFDVAFETHSVDLVFDVEKVVTLTDDNGTAYTPHWDGSPPGGHHRSGTLRFTPDLPSSATLTLTFKDVADIPMRTFSWEVNQ